jgi:hypothetical protein
MESKQLKSMEEFSGTDINIKRQVKGILQDYLGVDKAKELRNEELFYRAIHR